MRTRTTADYTVRGRVVNCPAMQIRPCDPLPPAVRLPRLPLRAIETFAPLCGAAILSNACRPKACSGFGTTTCTKHESKACRVIPFSCDMLDVPHETGNADAS